MRKIIAGHSKEDLINASNDINYEIVGKEIIVKDTEFTSFWESDLVSKFYKKRGVLIDDYETTIITSEDDLYILKETIEQSSAFKLKKNLLELVTYAIVKKSGIIFIF
ncbi:hypothetical protein [Ferruginibacter sp.]